MQIETSLDRYILDKWRRCPGQTRCIETKPVMIRGQTWTASFHPAEWRGEENPQKPQLLTDARQTRRVATAKSCHPLCHTVQKHPHLKTLLFCTHSNTSVRRIKTFLKEMLIYLFWGHDIYDMGNYKSGSSSSIE